MILISKELFFMNITQKMFVVGTMVMSAVALKAYDRDEAFWLMRARNCTEDYINTTEYVELTVKNFAAKDENGKNIYQIALGRHKETGSIRCARLALFLEQEEQKLRKKLEEEIKILDGVEKTFETPHQ
jgi:hypothetical protein